jgi:hypothetical protein
MIDEIETRRRPDGRLHFRFTEVSPAAVRILSGVVALHAWNSAEVLVDRAKVMVGEMTEVRPGHDLEQVSIEWFWNAIGVGCARARGVEMIGIDAGADGVEEFFEAVATDRFAAGVGSEVARDDFS